MQSVPYLSDFQLKQFGASFQQETPLNMKSRQDPLTKYVFQYDPIMKISRDKQHESCSKCPSVKNDIISATSSNNLTSVDDLRYVYLGYNRNARYCGYPGN